jgi:hypothetical protein
LRRSSVAVIEETLEGRVLDLDFAMQIGAQGMRHIDAHAGRGAGGVGHLERRVIELHPDDQRRGGRVRPQADHAAKKGRNDAGETEETHAARLPKCKPLCPPIFLTGSRQAR